MYVLSNPETRFMISRKTSIVMDREMFKVPFSCLFVLLCLTILLLAVIAIQSPSQPRVRGLLTYGEYVHVSVRYRPAIFQGDVVH